MTNRPLYFDGNIISNISGLLVLQIENFALPNRDLGSTRLASADRSALTSAYYVGRKIVIEGVISLATRTLLEQSVDTLKQYLQGVEGKLEMMQAGSLRRYYATMQNVIISNNAGGYAAFSIEFLCSDPLGYEAAATTLSFTNPVTAASSSQTANTIGGNYPAQPLLTATIGAVSGGTNAYVQLSNGVTGAGIKVTRNWTAADVLQVDCLNRTVKVNGVETDYTGTFPTFAVGASTIKYDDNFVTSRSVTLAGSYSKRYL